MAQRICLEIDRGICVAGCFFISGGLLYILNHRYGAVLCVPDVYDESGVNHRKRIFDEMHGTDYRGHRGKTATLNAIRERFWWPNSTVDVTSMLKACEKCQLSKIDRRKPQGTAGPRMRSIQHYHTQ